MNIVKDRTNEILIEKKIHREQLERIFNIPAGNIILTSENKYTSFYEFSFKENSIFNKIEARTKKDEEFLLLITIYLSPNSSILLDDAIDTRKNKAVDFTVIPNAGIQQASYLIDGKEITYSTSVTTKHLVSITINYEPQYQIPINTCHFHPEGNHWASKDNPLIQSEKIKAGAPFSKLTTTGQIKLIQEIEIWKLGRPE